MSWVRDDTLRALPDKVPYTFEPHSPQRRRGMPWLVCKFCGLVYLRNDFTRWAIKKGCRNSAHPGRRRWC